MSTTSVDLGKHYTQFVADLKASGRYRNTSEAIRAGLRLLEEQEAGYQVKLEHLRSALIEGENSGESPMSHKDIIDEVKSDLGI